MILTIVLRQEVVSLDQAITTEQLIRMRLNNFPEMTITAQANTVIPLPEPPEVPE